MTTGIEAHSPAMRNYTQQETIAEINKLPKWTHRIDVGNWWAPNKKCIEGMLRTSGFGRIDLLAQNSDRVYYRVRL